MSRFDQSSLLKFLHKPRCRHEIIRHFKVSTKLVDYHLQEAIKCGRILVYGNQISPQLLDSEAKQLRQKGLLYVSRQSPMLAKDLPSMDTLPKTRNSATRESMHPNPETSVLSRRKPVLIQDLRSYLKLDRVGILGVFHHLSGKMRLSKNDRRTRQLKWKTRYDSSENKSLMHAERIRLFQALSNQPMPFLDIHRRFDLSRQTVEGFVRRGLFEEVWGPKNIGIKFKLTKKGEAYLKRLKEASRFELQQRKKIFISLKHRVSS